MQGRRQRWRKRWRKRQRADSEMAGAQGSSGPAGAMPGVLSAGTDGGNWRRKADEQITMPMVYYVALRALGLKLCAPLFPVFSLLGPTRACTCFLAHGIRRTVHPADGLDLAAAAEWIIQGAVFGYVVEWQDGIIIILTLPRASFVRCAVLTALSLSRTVARTVSPAAAHRFHVGRGEVGDRTKERLISMLRR